MAASWIEKKAEEYRKREDDIRLEAELRLHKSSVIDSHWLAVKDSLESAVREDVAEWNAAFRDDPSKRIDGVFRDVIGGFRILKNRFPGGTATVTFKPAGALIQCDTIKPAMIGPGMYSSSTRFYIRVAADDSVYLVGQDEEHLSLQQVSQRLIESLTE